MNDVVYFLIKLADKYKSVFLFLFEGNLFNFFEQHQRIHLFAEQFTQVVIGAVFLIKGHDGLRTFRELFL